MRFGSFNPRALPSRIRGRADIWPPSNYRRPWSRVRFWLVDIPLAFMGGYLPQRPRGTFSTFFDEHLFVQDFFARHPPEERQQFAVDIGAGDGLDMSNTYQLYAAGWRGLAVEASRVRFAQLAVNYRDLLHVSLARQAVSPSSVTPLIRSSGAPRDFGLLNLDIDSWDYFVLREILEDFRPQLAIVEVNRLIPPPLKFTVRYRESDEPTWRGDEFQGLSLSLLESLANEHDYRIVEMRGAAVFIVPASGEFPARAAADVYSEDYLSGPERWIEPWPAPLAGITDDPPEVALRRIESFFAERSGAFELSL